jgi:hypothetical protein
MIEAVWAGLMPDHPSHDSFGPEAHYLGIERMNMVYAALHLLSF